MSSKHLLRIEYVLLSQAAQWDWVDNPKLHDIEALIGSLKRYGFQDPPKFDQALNGGQGGLVAGNGRVRALVEMQARGEPPPLGLALTARQEWAVPIVFGNDLPGQVVAEAFALDHNNLTLAGGSLDTLDMARMWDVEGYNRLLSRLQEQTALPVTVNGEDLDALLARLNPAEGDTKSQTPADRPEKEAGTVVNVGRFFFKLEREQYTTLIEDIRQNVGFDETSVRDEICRRLGLKDEG